MFDWIPAFAGMTSKDFRRLASLEFGTLRAGVGARPAALKLFQAAASTTCQIACIRKTKPLFSIDSPMSTLRVFFRKNSPIIVSTQISAH